MFFYQTFFFVRNTKLAVCFTQIVLFLYKKEIFCTDSSIVDTMSLEIWGKPKCLSLLLIQECNLTAPLVDNAEIHQGPLLQPVFYFLENFTAFQLC